MRVLAEHDDRSISLQPTAFQQEQDAMVDAAKVDAAVHVVTEKLLTFIKAQVPFPFTGEALSKV